MVTSDLGACEWFVWDLRRSGLIDRGQLDTIIGEFLKRNPRAEAPALAEYLVDQETITPFQAERILNGKTAGLVLGPYVLLDAIGTGSMGQVYRATSKNDEHEYAVKVLPRRSMWNVRLARRQVRSFSNFSHPSVVPFVDVGTAGGLHYLVWNLVEGATLEGIVQQMGKLPPNLSALYAVQVAQGLIVAHQSNLFHGLLKPSNVMVGTDNQARILDFGIGSLLVENEGESLVDTMSTANTLTSGLDCSAPESIMDPTNRTPAGDQYSLGCMLYFSLTGRVPFPEGSAVEKMMAHQTREPMPVQELSPEVPDGLVAVVQRLMAKKPEDRFTGLDELVEALEPFLGDLADIPGGVPGAMSGSGSGRVPTSSMHRGTGSGPNRAISSASRPAVQPGSGPRMPGQTNRPSGPHQAVNPGSKGLPATSAKANPGVRMNPPPAGKMPGHQTGRHVQPQAGALPQTPPPARGPSLPSRASFQLPAMADEIMDTGPIAAMTMPAEPVKQPQVVPGRPRAGWADEEPERRDGGGGFGPVGLIAAALLLMVAVYFGATMLMKS